MADVHPIDTEIRRLVSSSIADFQVGFMDGVGELMRQLGDSLEAKLVERHSCMLNEQIGKRAPLGDRQLTVHGASSHASGSPVALPIGNGLMCVRPPQSPALPESNTDSIDARLVPTLLPLKSLHESSDMSTLGERTPRCEAGPEHTPCVREASHESAPSQKQVAIDDSTTETVETLKAWWREPSEETGPSGRALKVPLLHRIVNSNMFEMVFSFLILLNCAFMGVEAHESVQHDIVPWMVEVLGLAEHGFATLFSIELILRVKVFGCATFLPTRKGNLTNCIDAFIVIVSGICFTWLIPICGAIIGFSGKSETVRSFAVVRSIRLLRLVRVFQRFPMFREAWLLMYGLSSSLRTLFWTVLVISFVTYVFAIFGLVLIVKDLQAQYYDTVEGTPAHIELGALLHLFGGIDLCMYTLIQVLTGDSFHAITRNVLKYISWSWFYFYSYIAVANFVMMNLVTAIIVDNCVAATRQDEYQEVARMEREKKNELQNLQNIFRRMDADSSGTISWHEFKKSFKDPYMINKWLMLDFEVEECRELFGLLDDGGGEINTEHFFDGLHRLRGPATAKDVFQLQKSVDYLKAGLDSWRSELSAPKPASEEL